MMRYVLGLSMAAILAAVGCSSSSSSPTPLTTTGADAGTTDAGGPKSLCMLADLGGLNDKSFNETAFSGVKQANTSYGFLFDAKESKSAADYQPNMDGFLATKSCTVIISVGFGSTDVAKDAATKNPDLKFQVLDTAVDPEMPNVWSQLYATEESSFLAGYTAAAFSKSGKVATFGGMQIPPVMDFMDGFAKGVEYYNSKKAAQVQLIGWDRQARTGLFSNDFNDKTKGKTMGEDLLNQGVDVIFPVAGPLGLGTAEAAYVRGNAYVIGVDSDWTQTAPSYKDVVLTSVVKRLDRSVVTMAGAVNDGTFKGGTYRGNLKNGEVDIAPFYGFDAKISADIKADLASIRQDIIDGKIQAK